MIEIIKGQDFENPESRAIGGDAKLTKSVADIIGAVQRRGDAAILELTKKIDNISLENIRVDYDTLLQAEKSLDPSTRDILKQAVTNVREFHTKQIATSWQDEFDDGTRLGELVRPIDRAGIYVPGGTASYPSTLIMNVIPAMLAGVPAITVASPPQENGLPNPIIMALCCLLEINEVVAAGGALAIAAMAYGTKTILPVCKITGPGNKYVAEAKRQVFGHVGIDSIAGPSEILILHDDTDVPIEFIVRDLLSQAEHDEEAQSILVTSSEETAHQVLDRINELVPTLPRKEIIEASLKNHGQIVIMEDIHEGIAITNAVAPEHLELLVKDNKIIDKIRNAGAIFVGQWSTEAVGDYFAGPNHTIPTNGAARYGSPLSVRDFQKRSSLIEYSKDRLLRQGEQIAKFAEIEDLPAHAAAVRARLT